MSAVGEPEIRTQRSVVQFFRESLGYSYLGHWQDCPRDSSVETSRLVDWLKHRGYGAGLAQRAVHQLAQASVLSGSKTLYDANREVYQLLRYGVKLKRDPSAHSDTVRLIEWDNVAKNEFCIAEEVTVIGPNTKRPDIVLYVNGIALVVLELKRSTVSVTEGIRQNLDSQKKEFIESFFATVQLVLAGSETEGLRYGVIGTPEKHWLHWKEAEAHLVVGDNRLLRELNSLCSKQRLLEIVHDFIVFDSGTKKTCRHNQYFGVKAAQAKVRRREGGIIWHTQGSGKSLTMVWVAKWIRENVPNGRVLIVTDRTELDEQIESVFKGVSEDIHRTTSGADLVSALDSGHDWLMGSLIHKFGPSGEFSEQDLKEYLKQITDSVSDDFHPAGEIFIFVDECHRTQSGRLHRAMKSLLPNAMLVGFTGTPLLKHDKRRSIETFGPYIHTYKYDEAVGDGVVLDLRYEVRDIDQSVTSQDKIDEWFEAKTEGLTDSARAQIKHRWGNLQSVESSENRLRKIVADICFDMGTRDRLKSGLGNAILVAANIYSAYRLFEIFEQTELAGKCAVVTSYKPSIKDIKGEETGEGKTEKQRQYDICRRMLAAHFSVAKDTAMHKAERFEQEVKRCFIDKPNQMKLVIVVDMLLTGFDAPPATCLYIDKKMQDHGLFQAICRVNRRDSDDKEYGYIIDYKDLFRSLEQSVKDYTGEAFEGYDQGDVDGLLKDRLKQGRARLEETLEAIKALCEPVERPRDNAAYVRFFCAAESGNAEQLKHNESNRVMLYKLAATFLRAYANLANEMRDAGYSSSEASKIKAEVKHYEDVRRMVKLASGDYVDMKMYEPAMRHLLDMYIRAEDSKLLSKFDDRTLVDLIVEQGDKALAALPDNFRENLELAAETIANNVRRLIVDRTPVNPRYYEKMSKLLDDLIQQRRKAAADYKAYLAELVALAKQVTNPEQGAPPPPEINTPALGALFANLPEHYDSEETRVAKTVALDSAIRDTRKADWRENRFKRREVRNAIRSLLESDEDADKMFEIVEAQDEY